jgi:hypothetical protein
VSGITMEGTTTERGWGVWIEDTPSAVVREVHVRGFRWGIMAWALDRFTCDACTVEGNDEGIGL